MHRIKVHRAIALSLIAIFPFRSAWGAEPLPSGQPVQVHGIEVACTGESLDVRRDARWSEFPLKIEFAGPGGQYVGGETVSIGQANKEILNVVCGGPWLMVRLPPARYDVSATLDGLSAKSAAFVSKKGQGHIILRFLGQPLAMNAR